MEYNAHAYKQCVSLQSVHTPTILITNIRTYNTYIYVIQFAGIHILAKILDNFSFEALEYGTALMQRHTLT